MAENLGKWPSKRGPISEIRPSDGRGRDAVFLALERRYDFPESGGYLGNVGLFTTPPNFRKKVCIVNAKWIVSRWIIHSHNHSFIGEVR